MVIIQERGVAMELETLGYEKSAAQRPSGCEKSLNVQFPKGSGVILFVDDEILLTQLGADMLERMGYRSKTSTVAAKALALFKNNPAAYDLLIADLYMPEMSGVDLSAECKKIKPDFPTIISSGQSFLDPAQQRKIEALDIEAIIHKPYTFIDLARIVRSVLDKRRKGVQAG